jgi:DnaJ-class molecular chaperone
MWKWLKSPKKLKHYYDILGVSPDASPKAIQRAFWKAAQKLHPDINPDVDALEQFKEVVEAYRALKGTEARNDYDARVISEYCQSFLGSFEANKKPGKEKHLPIILAWKRARKR